jgi:hypothetical protein
VGTSSIRVYEAKIRIQWDVRGMNSSRPVRRADSLMLRNNGVALDMDGEVTTAVIMWT